MKIEWKTDKDKYVFRGVASTCLVLSFLSIWVDYDWVGFLGLIFFYFLISLILKDVKISHKTEKEKK